MKREQAERLQRALGKLRKKERALITIHYIEGLSLEKMAECYFFVARETVRQQLIKAEEKLKRFMDE